MGMYEEAIICCIVETRCAQSSILNRTVYGKESPRNVVPSGKSPRSACHVSYLSGESAMNCSRW